MALTIEINSVARYVLASGSWSIKKRLTAETFSFTIVNNTFSASAYRPVVGDSVHVTHGADLVFGGKVMSVLEYRANDEGPIAVDIECRGWELLAEQLIISGVITSGPIKDRVYSLFQTYLQPKGVSWLGATTGGPTIPEVTYKKSTLADLLTRVGKLVNYTWRINGDKQLGLVDPGDLVFPVNPLTGNHFKQGLRIDQDYLEYGTRLILETGGSGDADHSETHTGNGLKTYFALNVEQKPDEIDDAGIVTSYIPTQVIVNGVTNIIGGGVWSYDSTEHAVYKSGAAVPNGHSVYVAYKISFPATVRVWDATVLNSNGTINIANRIDKMIKVSQIIDVAEAKAWGDVELSKRAAAPKRIKGSVFIKGFYPLLTGTVTLAEHNVNGSYLVESVSINDIGIDPEITVNNLLYQLDLIEGDSPGRQWEDLFREYAGEGSGGGSAVASGTSTPLDPPSIVQVIGNGSTSRVANFSQTFATAPAIGSVVVVCASAYDSSASTSPGLLSMSVTDNRGNTYTLRAANNNLQRSGAIWVAQVVNNTAPFTVTVAAGTQVVSSSGGDYLTLAILEIKDVELSQIIHVAGQATGLNSVQPNGGLPSTTVTNTLVIGAISYNTTGSTITPSSAVTQQIEIQEDSTAKQALNVVSKNATLPGSHNPTWTISGSAFLTWGGAAIALTGKISGPYSTASSGSVMPAGTTMHLGGDNYNPVPATTTFVDIPQAIPRKLGGDGMSGSWTFKAYGFQISAGTMEIRLYDQTSAAALSTVSLTNVAAALSNGFGVIENTFSAPSSVKDVIAQYRVTSGSRDVVIGHCIVYKN